MTTAFQLYMNYWQAEEAHDLEKMLSFYGDDSDYDIPGAKVKGSALRARWTNYLALNHIVKHKVLRHTGDENRAWVEWEADITEPGGRRFVSRGVAIVDGDGERITSMTSYFDPNG